MNETELWFYLIAFIIIAAFTIIIVNASFSFLSLMRSRAREELYRMQIKLEKIAKEKKIIEQKNLQEISRLEEMKNRHIFDFDGTCVDLNDEKQVFRELNQILSNMRGLYVSTTVSIKKIYNSHKNKNNHSDTIISKVLKGKILKLNQAINRNQTNSYPKKYKEAVRTSPFDSISCLLSKSDFDQSIVGLFKLSKVFQSSSHIIKRLKGESGLEFMDLCISSGLLAYETIIMQLEIFQALLIFEHYRKNIDDLDKQSKLYLDLEKTTQEIAEEVARSNVIKETIIQTNDVTKTCPSENKTELIKQAKGRAIAAASEFTNSDLERTFEEVEILERQTKKIIEDYKHVKERIVFIKKRHTALNEIYRSRSNPEMRYNSLCQFGKGIEDNDLNEISKALGFLPVEKKVSSEL